MFGGGDISWTLPNGNLTTAPTRVIAGINELQQATLPLVSSDFNNNEVGNNDKDLMTYAAQSGIDVNAIELDIGFANDGSVLSEAVYVSANQNDNALNWIANLPDIKIEFKEEPAELPEIQPDLLFFDNPEWSGWSNMDQELGPGQESLFDFQPSNEIICPISLKPEPAAQEPAKRKRRKQELKPTSICGSSGHSQHQVNEITTTSIKHYGPVKSLKKEPKILAKPKRMKAHKLTAARPRKGKVPLYMLDRSDCKDNNEWQRAKRAQNTKQFHEKQKKKLQVAEEVMKHLMMIPACRKQFGVPEVKAKLERYFPEILK